MKEKDKGYDLPKGMQYFPDKGRVELTFTKPVEGVGEGYQVVRLVQLTADEIVVPRFIVKRPRKVAFGRVKSRKKWESVLIAVGGQSELFFLPTGKKIKSYVFLVRSLDGLDSSNEKTAPWSVWQVKPTDIWKNDADVGSMKLPKLSDLELLKARKDGATIQKKVESATKFSQNTEPWVDE